MLPRSLISTSEESLAMIANLTSKSTPSPSMTASHSSSTSVRLILMHLKFHLNVPIKEMPTPMDILTLIVLLSRVVTPQPNLLIFWAMMAPEVLSSLIPIPTVIASRSILCAKLMLPALSRSVPAPPLRVTANIKSTSNPPRDVPFSHWVNSLSSLISISIFGVLLLLSLVSFWQSSVTNSSMQFFSLFLP